MVYKSHWSPFGSRHTMQIFWQPIAEWSVYIESAVSLIRILERPNGKAKTHCTLSVFTICLAPWQSKETLCPKSLAHLGLANCYWDSLCPILGFREFPQVDRFMLLGFSVLDPPSHPSKSSWSSGTGNEHCQLQTFKNVSVSFLSWAGFSFFMFNERCRERIGCRSYEQTHPCVIVPSCKGNINCTV